MIDSGLDDQAALCLQCLLNVLVRFLGIIISNEDSKYGCDVPHLDVLSNKVRDLSSEATRVVDRAGRHLFRLYDSMSNRNTMIVFTECWGLVNNTSTIGISDVGVNDDAESLILKLDRC